MSGGTPGAAALSAAEPVETPQAQVFAELGCCARWAIEHQHGVVVDPVVAAERQPSPRPPDWFPLALHALHRARVEPAARAGQWSFWGAGRSKRSSDPVPAAATATSREARSSGGSDRTRAADTRRRSRLAFNVRQHK